MATAQAMLGRAADVQHRLAVELGRVAGADRQDAARGELAGSRHGRGEALGPQLAEGGRRGELAAGPPVQLAEGTLEGRLADDRDDEDVGDDIPGLVIDDAHIHGCEVLRSGADARAQGPRRADGNRLRAV